VNIKSKSPYTTPANYIVQCIHLGVPKKDIVKRVAYTFPISVRDARGLVNAILRFNRRNKKHGGKA